MERQLINDFLNATSIKEVDALVFQYCELLDECSRLYSFARNARKRINNLRRELIHNTNLIYQN
jgi:hypothetical protein